jgi:hypothetical protein
MYPKIVEDLGNWKVRSVLQMQIYNHTAITSLMFAVHMRYNDDISCRTRIHVLNLIISQRVHAPQARTLYTYMRAQAISRSSAHVSSTAA